MYDNRAIAIVYFGSENNAFIEKTTDVHQAIAEGDSERVKGLDEWVEKFQCQIHFQGFCRVPVDDLLLVVKDKLSSVVKSSRVDIIGW